MNYSARRSRSDMPLKFSDPIVLHASLTLGYAAKGSWAGSGEDVRGSSSGEMSAGVDRAPTGSLGQIVRGLGGCRGSGKDRSLIAAQDFDPGCRVGDGTPDVVPVIALDQP